MSMKIVKKMSLLILLFIIISCSKKEVINDFSQLDDKVFGIPTGTIADQLILSVFPNAKFKYYNSVIDAAFAVKSGHLDVAAYDEPILRNIAAKNPGLKVLDEMITNDHYGFAVRQGDIELKASIDQTLAFLNSSGIYDDMLTRWLPKSGNPKSMPDFTLNPVNGVLRFGTSSVTEPFSFIDSSRKVVGLDIELAYYIAKELNMGLEIVNMDFGALIPALLSNKVDFIGACITISEERAKSVLFSDAYYTGGIAALVRD